MRIVTTARILTACALVIAALSLTLPTPAPLAAQDDPPAQADDVPPANDTPTDDTPTGSADIVPTETPTVTEAPPPVTDVPVVTTEAPPPVTDAPVVTTEAPPMTDVPVVTTEAPPVTDVPVVTTEAPPVTDVPVVTTEAPPVTDVPLDFVTVTPPSDVRQSAFERPRGARLDPVLAALAAPDSTGNAEPGARSAAAQGTQQDEDREDMRVYIEVIAASPDEADRLRPLVEALGGEFLIGYENRLEFIFPVVALETLALLEGDFVVVQPQEGKPRYGTRKSEGVVATGAQAWHNRGINGTGVRIGVIDAGFQGMPNSDTTGCVVSTVNFMPYYTLTSLGDHGTNVVEIVCDMAPGADVYVAQAWTLSSMNAAIDWLIAQDVDVISMSQGFEKHSPGDGTGAINRIVQRAIDAGIVFVNAAGNERTDTYHADFRPVTGEAADFDPDGAAGGLFDAASVWHDFDPGSGIAPVLSLFSGDTFTCGASGVVPYYIGTVMRYANWNSDRTGNASFIDYDLVVVGSTDGGSTWNVVRGWVETAFGVENLPLYGANAQSLYAYVPPIEEVEGQMICQGNMQFGLAVNKWFGADNPHFILTMFGHPDSLTDVDYGDDVATNTSGLAPPADSADVIAVAAGEIGTMSGFSFAGGYPGLAEYSSRGPALGPGGTAPDLTTAPTKPEVTAPTNVTTTRGGGFFTAFNGTSAAAPHVGGFVALLMQQNRAEYDALSGTDRVRAIRDDLMTTYVRPIPTGADIPAYITAEPECVTTPRFCFGAGAITTAPDWVSWSDTVQEDSTTTIIQSGVGWQTVSASGASGGNYAYSDSVTAAVRFDVQFVTRIVLRYWRNTAVGGTPVLTVDGTPIAATGTPFTLTGTAGTATATFDIPYKTTPQIVRITNENGNGLSLDSVQLVYAAPTTTHQENQLAPFGALFGSWSRGSVSGASGGSHSTTTQTGSGVHLLVNSEALMLVYTARRDGGIIEAWVNGRRCEGCFALPGGALTSELSLYNGGSSQSRMQQIALLDIPVATFGAPPYSVTLRNTGRRVSGATGTAFSLDALRFPDGTPSVALTGVEVETALGTPPLGITLNGAWSQVSTSAAFAGALFSTSTPGAEYRFETTTARNVAYLMTSSTGGMIGVRVNGQVCAACGTFDSYSSSTVYRVPFAFEIPAATFGAYPYTVTLYNTGARHAASTGTTFALDRVEALGGAFNALPLTNITASQLNGSPAQWSFALASSAVIQRQSSAVSGDVYVNSGTNSEVYRFSTSSRLFTLITAVGSAGGLITVQAADDENSAFETVATFNSNASSTIWRWGIDVALPASVPDDGATVVRVLVETQTRFGSNANVVYVDAVLLNDDGALLPAATAVQDTLNATSPELLRLGPGWAVASNQTNVYGGGQRYRSASSSASVLFRVPNASARLYVVFPRLSDGGIAEVWVNGTKVNEFSLYAPVPIYQETLALALPNGTQYPAVVEIRNTTRKTSGAANTYLYIDGFFLAGSPNAFPTIPTGVQESSPTLSFFGASWTNVTTPSSLSVTPAGGSLRVTTQTSGGMRFVLNGTSRFEVVSSVGGSRGIVELYVDGRQCLSCINAGGATATLLDQFNSRVYSRVSRLVSIPTATFGAPPYVVELRGTNMRNSGSTSTGFDVDEISALDGGSVSAASVTSAVTYSAPDARTVASTLAEGGSYTLHQTAATYYTITVDGAYPGDVILLLRTMTDAGGVGEIRYEHWEYDSFQNEYFMDVVECWTCGTPSFYAPYTRFQMPYGFAIPDVMLPSPTTGDYVFRLYNSGITPAGSKGKDVMVDGFLAAQ